MDKVERLNYLNASWVQCPNCPLHETRHNVVVGYGNPDARIMIVGEGPGYNEDMEGYPFIGKAGMYLTNILSSLSSSPEVFFAKKEAVEAPRDLQEDKKRAVRGLLWQEYFFTNLVACRPPEDRTPNDIEIRACRERLYELIYTVDPQLIVSAGGTATDMLIGAHVRITHVRGEYYDIEIPGRLITYPGLLLATLHPSYLMRKNDWRDDHGETAKTFRDYFVAYTLVDEYSERHLGIPKPVRPYRPEVP